MAHLMRRQFCLFGELRKANLQLIRNQAFALHMSENVATLSSPPPSSVPSPTSLSGGGGEI